MPVYQVTKSSGSRLILDQRKEQIMPQYELHAPFCLKIIFWTFIFLSKYIIQTADFYNPWDVKVLEYVSALDD